MCTGMEILAAASTALSAAGMAQQVSSANSAARASARASGEFAARQVQATERQRAINEQSRQQIESIQENQDKIQEEADDLTRKTIQENERSAVDEVLAKAAEARQARQGELAAGLPEIDLGGKGIAPRVVAESREKALGETRSIEDARDNARAVAAAFGDMGFAQDLSYGNKADQLKTLGSLSQINQNLSGSERTGAENIASLNTATVDNFANLLNQQLDGINRRADRDTAIGNLMFGAGSMGLNYGLEGMADDAAEAAKKATKKKKAG